MTLHVFGETTYSHDVWQYAYSVLRDPPPRARFPDRLIEIRRLRPGWWQVRCRWDHGRCRGHWAYGNSFDAAISAAQKHVEDAA